LFVIGELTMRAVLPLIVFVFVFGGCCGGLQAGQESTSVEVEAATAAPVDEPVPLDEVGLPPKRLGKSGKHGGVRFFARMDTDGDGGISTEEFRGTAERFAEVDTNGDGRIEATEFDAARPDRMGRMGDFMGRHDANEDGKISAEEFQGKETRFAKLDRDSDGFIDETEAPGGRRAGTEGEEVTEDDAADEASETPEEEAQ
jgi:hypothetical protein